VPQLYVLPFSGKAALWDNEEWYKVMTRDPCRSGMVTWQAEVRGGVHAANWQARVACSAEKLLVEFPLLQDAHLCWKWENPLPKTVRIKRAESAHMPVGFTTHTATVYSTSEKCTGSFRSPV